MSDLTNKTDAQLIREWNDGLQIPNTSYDAKEIERAVRRQSAIEREQAERMINKMKGANLG